GQLVEAVLRIAAVDLLGRHRDAALAHEARADLAVRQEGHLLRLAAVGLDTPDVRLRQAQPPGRARAARRGEDDVAAVGGPDRVEVVRAAGRDLLAARAADVDGPEVQRVARVPASGEDHRAAVVHDVGGAHVAQAAVADRGVAAAVGPDDAQL